jgi:hypothetical protein
VRADLDKVREERPLPAVLRPLYDDPAAHLPSVVEELRRYWQAALEPVWPRVRALCTADLAYRMEQFANGGLALVLANLHPRRLLHRRPAPGRQAPPLLAPPRPGRHRHRAPAVRVRLADAERGL